MKVPQAQQLPSGSWKAKVQVGNKRICVTRATKELAEAEAARIKSEYVKTRKIDTLKADMGIQPTLKEAMKQYVADRENVLSPSTKRGYNTVIDNRFVAYHDTRIDKINWQQAVNREAKLCGPKTLKNAWGLVKSSVQYAGGNCDAVRLPAALPVEKAFLDIEQIPAFITAAKDRPGEIGALLALHSLRRSEIYGLEWKDIDLKRNVIHVHQAMLPNENHKATLRKQNKTASSTRDVPILIPRLKELLTAGITEGKKGYIVTGALNTLRIQVGRICTAASLPDVGLHGLRHSFASLCYSLGISELATMRMGGWSDYGTMRKIYTHLAQKDQQTATDKLAVYFKNVPKSVPDNSAIQS